MAEGSLHQVELAIEVLRQGGLVAYPTDTLYGLGASALIDQAVARIYQVKRRPRHLPLPLLLAEVSEMLRVAKVVPEVAWRLAERFFPGRLTLVLLKANWVSDLVTAGGPTVAVRVPDHPVPRALVRGLGAPITGTSANLSGRPAPLTPEQVREQLGDDIDLIIEGGRCSGGVESTVVDVSGEAPVIRREGAVPRSEIEKALRITL